MSTSKTNFRKATNSQTGFQKQSNLNISLGQNTNLHLYNKEQDNLKSYITDLKKAAGGNKKTRVGHSSKNANLPKQNA